MEWSQTTCGLLSNIRGCIGHVHIPDQKRSKLDDKSQTCILLGVSEESKAYKLYNPTNNKVIISKDVVFEEDKSWIWHGNIKECMNDTREGEPTVLEDTPVDSTPHVPISHDTSSEALINLDSDSESHPPPAEGRAIRHRRPPAWMTDYETNLSIAEEEESLLAMMCEYEDPPSFEEAHTNPKWRDAMYAEINIIERNHTWELVDLPKGIMPIDVKWIFKTKLNESG